MNLKLLLYISLASLGLSVLTALVYEGLAHKFNQPLISEIVIPWVKSHNLWASLIGAVILGFFAFLILHFYAARN